jgi:hypothetical protein
MYNNTLYPFENEFVNMETYEYAIKRIDIFQFSFIAEPRLDCETMRESILFATLTLDYASIILPVH